MTRPEKCLLAATNNPDKLREIRQILSGSGWEVKSLSDFPPYPEPPENGDTLMANALEKAHEGFSRTGMLTLADDTGLEVNALQGEPGVKSARYAGDNATYVENTDLLLRNLDNVLDTNRSARFRCVMALAGAETQKTWEGVAEGVILSAPRGENGFGYDPVFWSPELKQTFAEASAEAKNQVSHRGRALAELPETLDKMNVDFSVVR